MLLKRVGSVSLANIQKFQVSAQLIKQLRELTGFNIMQILGSPISDCKKALEQCGDDMAKAQEYLKERGLVQAAKRSNKEAKDGVIGILTNENSDFAVVAEINCETDFVARTSEFLEFSNTLLKHLVQVRTPAVLEEKDQINQFLSQPSSGQLFKSGSADEARQHLIAKVQENIIVSKIYALAADPKSVFGVYQHNCYGSYPLGMAGCVIELQAENVDKYRSLTVECASNLATCYLGLKPKYLSRSQVPENIVEQEKQKIISELPEDKKKNQKALGAIVDGKLKRFYHDIVFEDMDYVLADEDQEITIRDYIKQQEKDIGKITLKRQLALWVK